MKKILVGQFSAMFVVVCVFAGSVACGHVGATSESQGSPFQVNTTLDTVDAEPGDGLCRDSAGRCSLRAAVMEANAWPGADTIELPPGTYALTQAGREEDLAATGDIDNSKIEDNEAVRNGGGIFNAWVPIEEVPVAGTLVMDGGSIARNRARGSGGGIVNFGATATLRNVSIVGNRAETGPGGGVLNSSPLIEDTVHAGRFAMTGGSVRGNYASAGSGGVANSETGIVAMSDVTIVDNVDAGG